MKQLFVYRQSGEQVWYAPFKYDASLMAAIVNYSQQGFRCKVIDLPNVVDPIQRFGVTTKAGNTLQFFYNPDNDLVVVDLIAANEKGGIELLRRTLNEPELLGHATKRGKK